MTSDPRASPAGATRREADPSGQMARASEAHLCTSPCSCSGRKCEQHPGRRTDHLSCEGGTAQAEEERAAVWCRWWSCTFYSKANSAPSERERPSRSGAGAGCGLWAYLGQPSTSEGANRWSSIRRLARCSGAAMIIQCRRALPGRARSAPQWAAGGTRCGASMGVGVGERTVRTRTTARPIG